MFTPALIGVLAMLISAFRPRNSDFSAIAICFLPVFIFLALRYGYGNDYFGYLEMFEWISNQEGGYFADKDVHSEAGWYALNYFFSNIGFFPMVAFIATITCYAYANFIRKYVPPSCYWLAIFLFVFFPEMMLIQASAMRQAISIIIFLFAIEYLFRRNFFGYFICILFATLFHSSAIFLFPVYFISVKKFKLNTLYKSLIFLVYMVLFFVDSSNLNSYLVSFSDSYQFLERYNVYADKNETQSGLGAIFFGILLLLLLWLHDRQKYEMQIMFRISMIGLLFIPMSQSLTMLARVAYYFNIVNIAVIPAIYYSLSLKKTGSVFLIFYMSFVLYSFYGFFQSPIYKDRFSEYSTIFSAPDYY